MSSFVCRRLLYTLAALSFATAALSPSPVLSPTPKLAYHDRRRLENEESDAFGVKILCIILLALIVPPLGFSVAALLGDPQTFIITRLLWIRAKELVGLSVSEAEVTRDVLAAAREVRARELVASAARASASRAAADEAALEAEAAAARVRLKRAEVAAASGDSVNRRWAFQKIP